MNDKEILDLSERLRGLTKEIIGSTDFKQLNGDISNTVNSALEEVRKQFKNTSQNSRQEKRVDTRYVKTPSLEKIKIKPVGKVAGTLYIVFGSIGLGITGIALLTLFIVGSVIGLLESIITPILYCILGLFVIFGVMLGKGIGLHKRLKRLNYYTSLVNGKIYYSTKDLAEYVGRTRRYVVKDLRNMIRQGMLPEAYLDEKENHLILNKDQYGLYLQEQHAIKRRKEQEDKLEKKRTSTKMSPLMKEGLAYVKVLREVKEKISGENISDKLMRLENIILKILDSLEKNSKHSTDMQRFMEYYLPTTIKLVNAYHEFELVDIQGENITTAKAEIETTLDTINQAFERLLDDLYEGAAFDVTTDAEVLQSMLAREGWTEKDFK